MRILARIDVLNSKRDGASLLDSSPQVAESSIRVGRRDVAASDNAHDVSPFDEADQFTLADQGYHQFDAGLAHGQQLLGICHLGQLELVSPSLPG